MTTIGWFLFGVFLCGYLCGLFPSGPWVARSKLGGRRLSSVGSGGTGATNVLRYAGWGRAAAVVLLDVAKVVVAILIARYAVVFFALSLPSSLPSSLPLWAEVVAAIGCLMGHCFPLWSKGLRGGKGVASTMGVLLMLIPQLLLAAVALWGAMLWWRGISSLASLVASAFLLLAALVWLEGAVAWGVAAVVGIVVWRHRENIVRLWRGEEKRVFDRKKRRA